MLQCENFPMMSHRFLSSFLIHYKIDEIHLRFLHVGLFLPVNLHWQIHNYLDDWEANQMSSRYLTYLAAKQKSIIMRIEEKQTLSVNGWRLFGSRNGGFGTPGLIINKIGVRACTRMSRSSLTYRKKNKSVVEKFWHWEKCTWSGRIFSLIIIWLGKFLYDKNGRTDMIVISFRWIFIFVCQVCKKNSKCFLLLLEYEDR